MAEAQQVTQPHTFPSLNEDSLREENISLRSSLNQFASLLQQVGDDNENFKTHFETVKNCLLTISS